MPRGPDKGKGFARWCNSRMKPSAPAAHHNQAPTPAPAKQQQQPLPQRKSRAIPIVAPPEVAAVPAAAAAAAPAAAAPVAVNNNLVVNLDSSDSDEGHFSDH